jgi:hypothetical protein
MPDGQPIKELPVPLPLWHVAIHQADETCIVGRFEQVHHSVHHDVLKALSRFLAKSVFKRMLAVAGLQLPNASSSSERKIVRGSFVFGRVRCSHVPL